MKGGVQSKSQRRREAASAPRANSETGGSVGVRGHLGHYRTASVCGTRVSVSFFDPPAFAALHNERCFAFVREMYEALDLVQWQTCVVCWRAWYDVPRSYHFRPQARAYSGSRAWFNFHSSSVLGATRRKDVDRWFLQRDERAGSHVDAAAFLKNNYDEATCQRLLDRLVDVHLKRDIVICSTCVPPVEDHRLCTPREIRLCDYVVDPLFTQEVDQALPVVVERWQVHIPDDEDEVPQMEHAARTTPVLGLSLQEFAAPLALLTDQEDMVISLVHPLLQVYTLRRTGQLAYVGHVRKFRQNVQKFVASLPILPQDMPFVMVRPRTLRN